MKSIIVLCTLVFVLSVSCGNVFGQTDQDAAESMYAYGEVVEVNTDSITVIEYDLETGSEKETVYFVKSDVKLENIDNITNLKKGDEIDLEYFVEEEKNKVVYIYVYSEEEDEVE